MNVLCIGSQRSRYKHTPAEIFENFRIRRNRLTKNVSSIPIKPQFILDSKTVEYQLFSSIYDDPSGPKNRRKLKKDTYQWRDIFETQKYFNESINLRYCHLNRSFREYSQIVHDVSMVIIFINVNNIFNHKYPNGSQIDNFNNEYWRSYTEQTIRMDISNHYGSHLSKKMIFYLLCFNSLKKQKELNKLPIWFVLDENYDQQQQSKDNDNVNSKQANINVDKTTIEEEKTNSKKYKQSIITDKNRKEIYEQIRLYLGGLASNTKIKSLDQIPNNIHFIDAAEIRKELNINDKFEFNTKWCFNYPNLNIGMKAAIGQSQCYFYQLFVAIMIKKTIDLNLKFLSKSLIKINFINEKEATTTANSVGLVELTGPQTQSQDTTTGENAEEKVKNDQDSDYNSAIVAVVRRMTLKGVGYVLVGTVIHGSYKLESISKRTKEKQGNINQSYVIPLPYYDEYKKNQEFDKMKCRSIEISGQNVNYIKKGDNIGINIKNTTRHEWKIMNYGYIKGGDKLRWIILSNHKNKNANVNVNVNVDVNKYNKTPSVYLTMAEKKQKEKQKQLHLNMLDIGIQSKYQWYQCSNWFFPKLTHHHYEKQLKAKKVLYDEEEFHCNMIHCQIKNFSKYYGNCKGGICELSDLTIVYGTGRVIFKVVKILKGETKEFTINTIQLWKILDSAIKKVYNNTIVLPHEIMKEILLTVHDLEYYMKKVIRSYESVNAIVVPNATFPYCTTKPLNRFTILGCNEVVGIGTFLKPKANE